MASRIAPVDVVLETDSRNPAAKHAILEMYVAAWLPLPDTPTMALHRGRIDLLEDHVRRDAALLRRTFQLRGDLSARAGMPRRELPRTPLAGATLLHSAWSSTSWRSRAGCSIGAAVDAPAAIDAQGFGGHTALFGAVVCYANFWGNCRGGLTDSPFARLLLDHGADPNARASLREKIEVDGVWTITERRDMTPLAWGQAFGYRMVVSEPGDAPDRRAWWTRVNSHHGR